MNDLLIIIVCLIIVAFSIGILTYLNLDKHRFRARRLWKELQPGFDRWTELTSALLAAALFDNAETESVEREIHAYETAKSAEAKSRAIDMIIARAACLSLTSGLSGDSELSDQREALEDELAASLYAYNETAAILKKKLASPMTGVVGRVLRFTEFVEIRFSYGESE